MNWFDFLLHNRGEVLERSVEHIGLVAASMAIALADRIAAGHRAGAPRRAAALGAGRGQYCSDDPEPRAFRLPDSRAVDRRSRRQHGDRCAGAVCAAANSAKHMYRHRGRGSRRNRVRARHGHDAAASALAGAVPLAAPVLLAGIRVATVISIGVATIAAAIGAGGLGVFIFRGVAMVNNQVILAGAIPAALLAVAAILRWDCFSGAGQDGEAEARRSGRYFFLARRSLWLPSDARFSSVFPLCCLPQGAASARRNNRRRIEKFHRADCAGGAVRAADRGAFDAACGEAR